MPYSSGKREPARQPGLCEQVLGFGDVVFRVQPIGIGLGQPEDADREDGWSTHGLVVGQGQDAVVVDRGADRLADLLLGQVGVDRRVDGHAHVQIVERLAEDHLDVRVVTLERVDQVRREVQRNVDVAALDLQLLRRRATDTSRTSTLASLAACPQ